MALTEQQKKSLEGWFSDLDWEYGWAEKLQEIMPIYTEMGMTKDTGAMIYMMSCILMQVATIAGIVKKWDEES